MVAHNASFEARFLGAELARVGGRWQGNQLCTMRLARRVLGDAPGSGRHTLAALTHRFGLNNPAPHRALGDAYVTLRLFEMLVSVAADRSVPWPPRRATSSAMLWPAVPADPPQLKPRAPLPLRW
jgi:DNA polymerase-3 subunit epsilon